MQLKPQINNLKLEEILFIDKDSMHNDYYLYHILGTNIDTYEVLSRSYTPWNSDKVVARWSNLFWKDYTKELKIIEYKNFLIEEKIDGYHYLHGKNGGEYPTTNKYYKYLKTKYKVNIK